MIIVWNIPEQKVVHKLSSLQNRPVCVQWVPHERNTLSFISLEGPLCLWRTAQEGVTVHKEACHFNYHTRIFRWNPKQAGKLALGHTDGSISMINPGQKTRKHELHLDEEMSSSDDNPVQNMEWDPLSQDYILVTYLQGRMKLIDSNTLTVITQYSLPSAAARVKTLSWIHNAPGMFITGG